jgi:hypothetical protein
MHVLISSVWFLPRFVHAVIIAHLLHTELIAIYSFLSSSIFLNSRQHPKQDADGATVWICPACGKVDDGTPMIGCDTCDAWYHW